MPTGMMQVLCLSGQTNNMSFNIYTKEGIHFVQWFDTVDKLIASMLANPNDAYHRIS
jgi:hypothetical protein